MTTLWTGAMGFTSPVTGAVERSAYGKMSEIKHLADFGTAVGDGTDATAALTAAITEMNRMGALNSHDSYTFKLIIPAGRYLITAGQWIKESGIHIEGDGMFATRITFSGSGALWKIRNWDLSGLISRGSIGNMTLEGNGAGVQIIGVDLFGMTEYYVHDITTDNWIGDSGSVATPSIGCRIAGHELSTIERCRFKADEPMHIRHTSYLSTATGEAGDPFVVNGYTSLDTATLRNLYLHTVDPTNTGKWDCLYIEPTVSMTTVNMEGFISMVGGRDGVRWLGTTTTPSTNLNWGGLKREQAYRNATPIAAGSFSIGVAYQIVVVGTTNWVAIGAVAGTAGEHFVATGIGSGTGTASLGNSGNWSFNIEGSIKQIALSNCSTDTYGHGYKLSLDSTSSAITLEKSRHGGTTTTTGLYVRASSYNGINNFFQTGCSIDMTGMDEVFGLNPGTGEALAMPRITFYARSAEAGYAHAIRMYGQKTVFTSGTLANGAYLEAGATPFAFMISDPAAFGVLEITAYDTNHLMVCYGKVILKGKIAHASNSVAGAELLPGNTSNFAVSNAGGNLTAGAFVVGALHEILTVGTTDFTLIGASANTIGVQFVATGVGSGTGTAAPYPYKSTSLSLNWGGSYSWWLFNYTGYSLNYTIKVTS